METPNARKRHLLEQDIAEFEEVRFNQTIMAQVWGEIGNAQAQEGCAQRVSEAVKAIALLTNKLNDIPAE